MNLWVSPKRWWIIKGLLTQWTTKWFLPCMTSWMCFQIINSEKDFKQGVQLKGLSPIRTLIRRLKVDECWYNLFLPKIFLNYLLALTSGLQAFCGLFYTLYSKKNQDWYCMFNIRFLPNYQGWTLRGENNMGVIVKNWSWRSSPSKL
jgi:hypothetical protein